MAISATINKVTVSIANMDTHYYQSHELTIAQHPSENNYRFMIRLIAFMSNASESLLFTKGMNNSDDEAELWQKSLSDEIELWIDFGQLDEKRIRKACSRSKQVIIYTYHQGKASVWWQQQQEKCQRFTNLKVIQINADQGIESLLQRNMQLQCNIQEDVMYLSDDKQAYTITFTQLN
jgi:uncharacterized protein YaeQ